MYVDPNNPINTRVRTILLFQGIISFIDGERLSVKDLLENNKLELYCKELDPNLDYIDILLPDDQGDREIFFMIRQKCFDYNNIHAQSAIRKPEAIWNYWEQLVTIESDNEKTQII
jgi:hypothetical protein